MTSNSTGTNHTPGASGAFSTWTNFGSTTTIEAGFVAWSVGTTNTDTAATALGYHWEFGISSTRIGSIYYRTMTTNENGWMLPSGMNFRQIPSGTQFMARATASGAGPEAHDIAAYIIY